KRLAVQKLKGGLVPRSKDEGGTRVGRTAECRVMVIAKSQIQDEVFAEVNFILGVSGKYTGGLVATKILNEGLKVVIALTLLKIVSEFETNGQSLGLKDLLGKGHLITPPFAMGEISVERAGRSTDGGVIVDVGAIVIELVVVDAVDKAPTAA